MRQIILLIIFFQTLLISAQGYITFDNFSTSRLRNDAGEYFGSGSMQMISGGYNIPLYTKTNERNQLTALSISTYATYADLSNTGEASSFNPDKIINTGLSLSYIHPISKKWSILVAGGAGIYAPADEIKMNSFLGNGGVIFIFRLNNNLSLGIGGGVSNSYGVPMAMPMIYLSWQRNGKFMFSIDMSNTIKISTSTILWDKLKLELAPMEVDGLMAVRHTDDGDQIYSMVMLQSYFSPSFLFSKKFSLFAKIGGNWIRGISAKERSLKSFFDGFRSNNNEAPYFNVSLRLSAGIRFSF